jgi:DNA-directed RNA polymerase alpha subunit
MTKILAAIRQAVKASEKPRSQILKEAGISQSQLSTLISEALDLEISVRRRSKKASILGEPVEILGLSVRTQNCLTQQASRPIRTVRQLVSCSEEMAATIPNSGPNVLKEIREKLAQHGLRLRAKRASKATSAGKLPASAPRVR